MDAYLTRRGRAAKQYHPHDIVVEYPESGVVRYWCTGHGGGVSACIDTVVLPEDFRASADTLERIDPTFSPRHDSGRDGIIHRSARALPGMRALGAVRHMLVTREEIDRTDVSNWLAQNVASEIEELRASEITADHALEWYRGVLAWFAKYYVDDDPSLLYFADGSGDGGIDIASLTTSEEGNTHIDVYQLSTPKIEALAEGRLVRTKTKFAADVRGLRNTVTGQSRKLRQLNATAQEVFRHINQARDSSDNGQILLTIEVHPLSLRLAHPDARREIDELGSEAAKDWSTGNEHWVVHPLRDVFDLYSHYQKKRPSDQSPPELRFKLFGRLSCDHPQRGPFLGFLRAMDVVKAYREWGAGLLDANLRFSLGKTEVNKLIRKELGRISGVKWFHEKNNGIVLTCNTCQPSRGQIKLVAPQIINGGQTIHSIATVIDQIEEIPLEKRTDDESELLGEIKENLRISARIVTISGGDPQKPDEIAIASNNQNKLSERTMKSSALEMRDLRLSLAALDKPWFVITKDGEWSAVSKQPRLFQSRTGNKKPTAFRRHGRTCRLENTDLGVALLAFLGFASEARRSQVFKERYFRTLFGHSPTDAGWQVLTSKRIEWKGEAFSEIFHPKQPSGPLCLVAYFIWLYWKTYTFPESRQILMAYEEEGRRNEEFKKRFLKSSGWNVSEEAHKELLQKHESCYWVEQIAKSAFLILVYQTMRVLVRHFGSLDGETCRRILELPQFCDLYGGKLIGSIGDFRDGSLTDGPLAAIGRILHYACEMLWQGQEERIRQTASRQQIFLQEPWIGRLSEQVDTICNRLSHPAFLHASGLEGPGDANAVSGLGDLLN